ncbi:hypothetical protein KBD71_01485 [Candidatus Woesebacteria bacterium]|nr:hypothetical protein [Candidatus Woesebacteria bacterium]
MSIEHPNNHHYPQRIFLGGLGLTAFALLPGCSAVTQTEREELVIRPNTESQLSSLWVQSQEVEGSNEIQVIVQWEQGNRTQLYRIVRLEQAVSVITYGAGTSENPRAFSLQYDANGNLILGVELLPDGGIQHVIVE